MLRRLIESFTTQTGSLRGDAKLLAGVLSRRAMIALELGGDEAFSSIHNEASSMLDRVVEESCKQAECKLIFDSLIQLQKDAVLLETKQNLRNPVSEVMTQALLPKKFFIEGQQASLSAKEYGIMSAELSFGHANNMLNVMKSLPHEENDTSLIHIILQNPDLATATFMAIGVGAYFAYIEFFMAVPASAKSEIGEGLKDAIERCKGNTELLMALIEKFMPLVICDVRNRGPSMHLYTETHTELIKFLSQKYSGREDIEDFEGLDSITLGPLADTYYLSIITNLRETARLRFAPQ
jgi:hypothetical protein